MDKRGVFIILIFLFSLVSVIDVSALAGSCGYPSSCLEDLMSCRTGSGITVVCDYNAYCKQYGPVASCDPRRDNGQPCTEYIECLSGNCYNNFCSPCSSNIDCPSGYACNPASHVCFEPGYVEATYVEPDYVEMQVVIPPVFTLSTIDTEKEIGESCTSNDQCESRICNSESIFTTGKVCVDADNWIGYCGASFPCSSDRTFCSGSGGVKRTCADDYYCNPRVTSCVPKKLGGDACSTNIECRSDNCYKESGASEGVCISRNYWIGACGSGWSCDSASTGCRSTSGEFAKPKICATDYYCRMNVPVTDDSCVEQLANGEICSKSVDCISGVCSSSVCTECSADPECDTDFRCENNICVQTCEDITCEAGELCNPATVSCAGSTCTADPECAVFGAEYKCISGSCQIPVPQQQHQPTCTTDNQCPAGEECSSRGECVSLSCYEIGNHYIALATLTSCPGNTEEGLTLEASSASNCDSAGVCCKVLSSSPVLIDADSVSVWNAVLRPDLVEVDRSLCGGSSCTTGSECPPGQVCESGTCTTPSTPPGPGDDGDECQETSNCNEDLVCTYYLSTDRGVCRECTTDDVDDDEDDDCTEDKCVGNPETGGDCEDVEFGLSCADAGGIVCGENEESNEGIQTSFITELNCWVPNSGSTISDLTCESEISLPQLGETGDVIVTKSCTEMGRMQVEILEVVNGQRVRIIDGNVWTLLGITANPYIDPTDYSCNTNLLAQDTSRADIPAYGLISILLTLGIISIFYFMRINKRLK